LDRETWRAYLSISYKDETSGKGIDETTEKELKPVIEIFKKYIPNTRYRRILNIGAGSGLENYLLEKEGYHMIGITLGKDNIQLAKKKFGIHLFEMDMHVLEFPRETFHGVYCVQTFEHSLSPWILTLEIYRVLKTEGRVLIDVPEADNPVMWTPWHYSLLYPDQIRRLFTTWGFKEININTDRKFIFIFEKLEEGTFQTWGYMKHVIEKRNQRYQYYFGIK